MIARLGARLDGFYRRIGDRGLLLAVFLAAAVFNTLFALRMSLPSYSYEFGTAALSSFLAGFNYYDALPEMHGNPGAEGWFTALLYTPVYYLIKEPELRYRCMLVLNSVIAAFIPLLTYRLTGALGLEKAWHRFLCAMAAAVSVGVFVQSKSISADTLCVFLPFMLLCLFTRGQDVKHVFLKILLSVYTGFILALAPAAHMRMWLLVSAYILMVMLSKYILNVNPFSLISLFISFGIFTVLQLYIGERITAAVAGRAVSAPFADGQLISEAFTAFFTGLPENLYYFAAASWGIGVLGFVLGVFVLVRAMKNRKAGTGGNSLIAPFTFFALVYNLLMLQHSDSALPFMLILALCCIFMRGLEFAQVLYTAGTLAVLFLMYYILADNAQAATISVTFCLVALLIVIVSCAERYRPHMLALPVGLVCVYTCLQSAFVYLPSRIRQTEEQSAPIYAVSAYIYNSQDAPATYVIGDTDGIAPLLQFLNRDTRIMTALSLDELPGDCFVITRRGDKYWFSARGERAEAYRLSQQ